MTGPAFEAVQRVASTPTLLVALDFDGTLAPTVDDPATARALPASVTAIEQLAKIPSTVVALVSGRSLGGLQEVAASVADVILVGSHGAETLVNGRETAPTLTREEHELLQALCGAIEAVAQRYEGARMERKPSGCGLHTRLSTPSDAESARGDALSAVERLGTEGAAKVAERYGKDILEFTVRAADKGSALERLRERTAATAVLFIGDDVTDEDGFRALSAGDVGIKVGVGESAAEYRIADPDEVSRLLTSLVTARREARVDTQSSRTP